MKFTAYIFYFCFLLGASALCAQQTEFTVVQDSTVYDDAIDPLTPAKAAFYSAVLPGLGQAYNKDYWKIPLVYAGIGASMYSYSWNNMKYHDYRDAYKRRLAGFNDDEYSFLDDRRLISAQRFHQRNRDLSLLVAVGVYVLNIVEANVAAHLKQFNVSERLSMSPHIYQNDHSYKPQLGVAINYSFK